MNVRRFLTVAMVALGLSLTITPAVQQATMEPSTATTYTPGQVNTSERDIRTATGAVQERLQQAKLFVKAKATPIRYKAIRWAKTQRGKRYCHGGNGPSCYDCSGLIVKAYHRYGISLPRVAADMRSSSKTRAVSRARARWGYLVFWGYGHVEFFGHKTQHGFWSIGAHHSGTKISYRWNRWQSNVHIERVVGAG